MNKLLSVRGGIGLTGALVLLLSMAFPAPGKTSCESRSWRTSSFPNGEPGAQELFLAAVAAESIGPLAPGDFNQNQILCDSDLLSVDSMSEADVQSLLDQRGSFFRDYYDPHTGQLASHIIYTEAQGHEISPRLILAKMQQESSCIWYYTDMNQLVDPDRPELGTRADWVLFYGWPDSGDPNPAYMGFYNQVHNASQSLRAWYDDPGSMGWAVGQPHVVGDGVVTPVNATTCALYIYTPWISSNNLLWQVWWMMWGDTGCSDGGGCCGCGKLATAGKTKAWDAALPTAPSSVQVTEPQPTLLVSHPAQALSGPLDAPEPAPAPAFQSLPAEEPVQPAAREAVDPLRVPPGSANYLIPKAVVGSGGGPKISTHYRMNGTQGQSTDLNRHQSANYGLMPGYWGRWAPSTYGYGVYLPLVVRNH